MHDDDRSIQKAEKPEVIRLGDGDSVVVDPTITPQPSKETILYVQGRPPDPDLHSPPVFQKKLEIGECRESKP